MSDEIFERNQQPPPNAKLEKACKEVEAARAMTDQQIAQKAFNDNRERLKAERLAQRPLS
jgi:hypothetical protein